MTVDVSIAEDRTVAAARSVEDNWLAGVWATLRARWWLVLATTILALLAVILYLRNADYLYTAELRVYAAPSTTGGPQLPSSLGGLASLAGISTPATEAASPFRLYLEGLRAREVAERMSRDRDLMRSVFAAEYDPRTRGWREPRSFAGGIKRGIWGLLGLPAPRWRAPDAARLQEFIAENVGVTQSIKTPLVSVSLDSTDPKFATRFLTLLGRTVDDYLRERQQERTRSNIEYLSEKLRGVTFVEQRQALFVALNEQERQAMLANSRAPYAANAFGVAVASTSPTRPRQVPLLIAGLLGGFIFGCAAALLLGRPRPRAVSILDGEAA